ncbi:MAG: class I SAM-dependent methyltransferase [Planctomycetota bacterium]
MNEPNEPIAFDAYQRLAEGYSMRAETKAENGYNEHPAMRRCVGDVNDLCILDAGCGPGFLTRDLLAAGARRVIGVDVSPKMIQMARQRVGMAAEFLIADLGQPLELSSNQFDLVVSSLALDYIRDWSTPLQGFHRLLKADGRLVFSVQHPMGSYKWFKPPSAFGVHYCETSWRGFTEEPVVVPDYYRSFEEIVNPLLKAGFRLNAVHETKPVEELREIDPRKHQKGSTFPTFLVLDAVKQSSRQATVASEFTRPTDECP